MYERKALLNDSDAHTVGDARSLAVPQQLGVVSSNACLRQAESSRNDGPFLAVALAAFVLPAAVILGIAASTGYLDKLAGGYGAGLR